MSLAATLHVDRGGFQLGVDLDVATGEVVALLGPNGAGKTTALRALAGLVPLRAGCVTVDAQPLDDPVRGLRIPIERRPIGVVFQDYLLFPHLTALENVAFGLRSRGMDKRRARAAARRWLDRVGLADYCGAKPRALSGGQAQRVALARALAVQPRLLLLDEPLAALDARTRLEVRADLRRHLAAFDGSTLVVTHDPLDAMVLADRLVVLEHGRLVQTGTPAQVARHPRTDYVARLVGLNLYRGRAEGDHTVRLPDGGVLTVAEPAHGDVYVVFPPSAVALYRHPPDGSPRNTWPARVTDIEQHGDTVRVHVDGTIPALVDVTAAAIAELQLLPGAEVWAALKATETHAYPA
jgi:molybdate transport system ATP-binding protein